MLKWLRRVTAKNLVFLTKNIKVKAKKLGERENLSLHFIVDSHSCDLKDTPHLLGSMVFF